MAEMSVARGLAQVKLLEKRIEKGIGEFATRNSIVCLVNASTPETKQKEFVNNSKAMLQSIEDLMNQRFKIKSAIMTSNTITLLTIGDRTFTVADAIERKTSIASNKTLLIRLKQAYFPLAEKLESQNEAVVQKAEANAIQLMVSAGEEKESSPELFATFVDQYIEKNKIFLLAPDGIESTISDMDKGIDEFEAEVDHLLSESNISTMIQV